MMKKQRLLTLALSCACVFTSAAAVGIWSLDTEKANAAWTNDGGAVKATSQKSAVDYELEGYELEEYVVAQNDDFGGATSLSWSKGDATSGLKLNNDLPTASFVYKFSYTPNGGGQTALALRSAYWGDYHFVFKGKTLQYNLKAGYVAVGEVFTDGPQLVEVGAIEIKNSDLTWFFLKVNG
ncbi:MAG: hypothetical protein J6S04_03470, partial [Clostridia bacterium]|nr:hypothetical protein [Clostridia bacterium]